MPKRLTSALFKQDLQALGFIINNNGTSDVSKWTYTYNGSNVSYGSLQGVLDSIVPGVYTSDAQGYHYAQSTPAPTSGGGTPAFGPTDLQPQTLPADVSANMEQTTGGSTSSSPAEYTPGSSNVPGQWYIDGKPVSGPLAQIGITYTEQVQSAVQADPTIDGETLAQQLAWIELAAYDAAVYGPILAEAFGTSYTSQDWYILASGAEGSGLMRAKIAEAQNRIAFREAYRLYNHGADPGPADYSALTGSYVSPNEFVTRMAAKESAKQMFDQINALLQRTLNQTITLAELENLAVNGSGSGELEAMIDEAERLDTFTDDLYQWLGRTPTAEDYAREVAGFASVDSFKWEISVRENVKAMGDDINDTLQRANQRRFTTDELRTMLGKSQGWGDLQALYNKSLEEEERQETSRKYAATAEKISPSYTQAFQGGIKEGLPELADLGGM